MRKMAVVAALLVFGAACAAPDPVLVEEPESEGVVVAEVQEEMSDHMDGADPASGEHQPMEEHHDDGSADQPSEHAGDGMGGMEAMGDPVVEVEVTLEEFEITPAALEIPVGGTVRFRVHNEGTTQHEFRLSNTHRVEEHVDAGHEEGHETEGHHDNADYLFLIEPGETRIVDITFPEGDTETYDLIVCLLPGHFEGGMKLELGYQE